ncbi:MAG TPA: patatin family protein [Kofleriaceae bacterium]|nr:patatin family protein [Kofleriaceae bacterium]
MITPRTAIVVEGGAMRGIYAAGVLDVFHEQRFHPFELAVGSSAGACNLASHLAGQHGRNRRCYTTLMSRPGFLDPWRFMRGGHWMDLEYLWSAFDAEDPLDCAAAAANPTRFHVAVTDVASGDAEFLEPTAADMNEVLLASSAVPVLFRSFVTVRGRRFADGGVSAPIPVEHAYRMGARKILVIRSRPWVFGGPSRFESVFAVAALRRHPGLVATFRRYREVYARSVAFLRSPPPDCRIVEIAPAEHLRTGRTTTDPVALFADYQRGRAAGERAIQAWG